MIHKCKYCDKVILPGSKAEDVRCTCNLDESQCEMSELVCCDGPICNFKLQVECYETKLQDLQHEVLQQEAKIKGAKAFLNQFRILAFDPDSLVELVKVTDINIHGVFIARNPKFSWDLLKPEDIMTLGQSCMILYEKTAKMWAQFLNEKIVKLGIKREHFEKTASRVKDSQEATPKTPKAPKESKPEAKIKLKDLNIFEKLVLQNMKLGLSQQDAEASLRNTGLAGEARDLKSLGLI